MEGLKMRSVRSFLGTVVATQTANRWFLSRANGDQALRTSLIKRFNSIAQRVRCEHTLSEMLVMADYILRAPDGPLVECGCYQGGSSAKLSLVAHETGRKLYICDSFAGLPPMDAKEEYSTISGGRQRFGAGQYAVSISTVKQNIQSSGGSLSDCEFVPGFYCDSLHDLHIEPVFIFSDADLISSTRDVLKNLWPRLKVGGRFYTHEANFLELLYGIMDPEFWMREIGTYPPLMFGAGYGCGFFAGSIAYCEKKSAESAKLKIN
jgi:O-methyltransferase